MSEEQYANVTFVPHRGTTVTDMVMRFKVWNASTTQWQDVEARQPGPRKWARDVRNQLLAGVCLFLQFEYEGVHVKLPLRLEEQP